MGPRCSRTGRLVPARTAGPDLAGSTLSSVTSTIKLGSAVTVLSTDDPVRVYERFATLDALSNGRAEPILATTGEEHRHRQGGERRPQPPVTTKGAVASWSLSAP